MKKLEIKFVQKITFLKTVEVTNAEAKQLMKVDGQEILDTHPMFDKIKSLVEWEDYYHELNQLEDIEISEV